MIIGVGSTNTYTADGMPVAVEVATERYVFEANGSVVAFVCTKSGIAVGDITSQTEVHVFKIVNAAIGIVGNHIETLGSSDDIRMILRAVADVFGAPNVCPVGGVGAVASGAMGYDDIRLRCAAVAACPAFEVVAHANGVLKGDVATLNAVVAWVGHAAWHGAFGEVVGKGV